MRMILIWVLLVALTVALWGSVAHAVAVEHGEQTHTCEAPCTVVFPEGMEEDEFQIDYADESLKVWR
jgi:hypothetical protein